MQTDRVQTVVSWLCRTAVRRLRLTRSMASEDMFDCVIRSLTPSDTRCPAVTMRTSMETSEASTTIVTVISTSETPASSPRTLRSLARRAISIITPSR